MLQQATTARSVSSRANTDQEQLHEQPRWAPPPPPTGQDRALTISLAPVLPQPPHTAHHTPTHGPDIVTIYYQYLPARTEAVAGTSGRVRVLQQSNSLAAPQPPPTEPPQTIYQTTQQYTTTYIHTHTHTHTHAPNTVIIHHQHILPLAQIQQTMPVLMCVSVSGCVVRLGAMHAQTQKPGPQQPS